MNQKGNLLIFILIGFVVVLLVPPILLSIFPPIRLLFQVAMIFMIYSMVKGYLGSSPLTMILSGVLIYFLVFKYVELTSVIWVFQTLLGFSFFSMVIWGIGTRMKG
ncbi:MAG TPA: hypothetical protein VJK05_05030 [archaeon]|nr:hypothetical protein [archaeon]